MSRLSGIYLLLCLACIAAAPQVLEQSGPVAVGTEGRIEVVLPRDDLQARPEGQRADVLLRIAKVAPWGEGFRYDLRYIAAEPGRFDLSQHLLLPDGSPAEGLGAVEVDVSGTLPQTHDGALTGIDSAPGWRLPWYWPLAGLVLLLWLVLLIPLVMWGRPRRQRALAEPPPPPPTLEDRLRPLVEAAANGTLDAAGKGRLERLLLAAWRQRLDLRDLPAAEALRRLRHHEEAGPLLIAVEDWLHRPPGSHQADPENVNALLRPYRSMPAAEMTNDESMTKPE